jgi:hypothetical protein
MANKLGQITIDFFNDSHVEVQHFPIHFPTTLNILAAAILAVSEHFLKETEEGKCKNGLLVQKADEADESKPKSSNSMIYTPKTPLVIPAGILNGKLRRN